MPRVVDHGIASNFTNAYSAAHLGINVPGFSEGNSWKEIIAECRKLASKTGPNATAAFVLSKLRARLANDALGGEANAMLEAAGAIDTAPIASDALAAKLSALKLIRHLYFLRKIGSHQIWIASLPDADREWPHVDFQGKSIGYIKMKLNAGPERFTDNDKKNLSSATQEGLRWVAKTLIVLGDRKKASSSEMLRNWFADESTSDADLVRAADVLSHGFKKIEAVLKSGNLILTDNLSYRGSVFEEAEAFVTSGIKRDNLDVVYIEKSFFDHTQRLTGLTHWTRILIHELSYREAGTDDIDVQGTSAYAWHGIKPTAARFPRVNALKNADSWAWFCADCAKVLTDGQRAYSLRR